MPASSGSSEVGAGIGVALSSTQHGARRRQCSSVTVLAEPIV